MRKGKFVSVFVLLVLLVSSLLTVASAQEGVDPDRGVGWDPGQIDAQLMDLEPYMQYGEKDGQWSQTFDAAAAQQAGFDKSMIQLAQQMVAYQNALAQAAFTTGIEDVTQLDVSLEQFPAVKAFMAAMTELRAAQSEDLQLQAQLQEDGTPQDGAGAALPNLFPLPPLPPPPTLYHKCGAWSNPIPNHTPPRDHFPVPWPWTPAQWLIGLGYHKTAYYACNFNDANCATDYTQSRSYNNCPVPSCFRNHGKSNGNYFWVPIPGGKAWRQGYSVQFGEPNPEIHQYLWPYWDWGAYVWWWHTTY